MIEPFTERKSGTESSATAYRRMDSDIRVAGFEFSIFTNVKTRRLSIRKNLNARALVMDYKSGLHSFGQIRLRWRAFIDISAIRAMWLTSAWASLRTRGRNHRQVHAVRDGSGKASSPRKSANTTPLPAKF